MEKLDNPLSRLANRARKKFNKKSDLLKPALPSRKIEIEYHFKKYDDSKDFQKFREKVLNMLLNNPDMVNPIGKLIDQSLYEKLSLPEKDRYITKLINNYLKVVEK